MSRKVNFWGQGNKASVSGRRAGEYPPARLLLPGGLDGLAPLRLSRSSGWRPCCHLGLKGLEFLQCRRALEIVKVPSGHLHGCSSVLQP
jgi:hypothetical protein